MTVFRYDGEDYDRTYVRYFVHTTGRNRAGVACFVTLNYSPVSGANPFHWAESQYRRRGHAFETEAEALAQAQYAGGDWSLSGIDTESAAVVAVEIHHTHSVRELPCT